VPAQRAGEGIELNATGRDKNRLHCPTWSADKCIACGVNWHKDSTCEQYQRVREERTLLLIVVGIVLREGKVKHVRGGHRVTSGGKNCHGISCPCISHLYLHD